MSGNFKKSFIGLAAFNPELVQGTENWSFRATGGTGTTITVDTAAGSGDHDLNIASAPDDYFNGAQVYFLTSTSTAALQGDVHTVSDFAVAANVATFTVDTMDASPAAGDLFYVFFPLQKSDITLEEKTENLPRDEFARLTLDPPSSNKGHATVSGNFKFELWGLETTLGNGATAAYDRLSQFLGLVGATVGSTVSYRAVAGTTVSGSGSTATVVDVTDASNFTVGDLVMIGGEVAEITAIDTGATPDNITLRQALSSAPADTTEVYFGESHTPFDTGHQSFTLFFLEDDMLHISVGCVCSVSISGQRGQNVQANCEFDGESWDQDVTKAISGAQSTQKGLPFIAGRAFFGATELGINQFEFNLGHGRSMLSDTIAGHRFFVTERKATCSVTLRNTGVTPKETWQASGTQGSLLVQVGNAAGAAFAIQGNAQIQDSAGREEVEGHSYYSCPFGFVDDQTSAATAQKPIIARF